MIRDWIVGTGLLGAVAAISPSFEAIQTQTSAPPEQSSLDAQESSAPASLIGQFRTSASGYLYLRADLYLHNGVEMRPLSDDEKKRGVQNAKAATSELGEGEGEEETTVIPGSDHDFRGLVGDIERACSTYHDMHNHHHNPLEKSMPLYRLMVWIDPSFVVGWTSGAMILGRDPIHGTEQAIRWLRDGLRQNPNDLRLDEELGYYYASRAYRPDLGLSFSLRAIKLGAVNPQLNSDQLDSLRSAYRWASLCAINLGDPELEHKISEEGLTRFPGDQVLTRGADRTPVVLTTIGKQYWEKGLMK